MVFTVVKELTNGLMAVFIPVTGRMVSRMGKGPQDGLTAAFTLEIGRTINEVARVLTLLLVEIF